MSLILFGIITITGISMYVLGVYCGAKATQERLMPIIDSLLVRNKELRERLDICRGQEAQIEWERKQKDYENTGCWGYCHKAPSDTTFTCGCPCCH